MPHGPSAIAAVTARQIFDSKGRPTVEAEVALQDGSVGCACVPSGSSKGSHEAWELRDGDKAAFGGLGVLRAVANVRGEIAMALAGRDARDQDGVDQTLVALDGTPSLGRLGANAILAVSLAAARAAAVHLNEPLYRRLSHLAGNTSMALPVPMANLFSGMDFQDFLVIPVGAQSFAEAVAMLWRVREEVARLMVGMGIAPLSADDGGLCPGFKHGEQALELMTRAFAAAGLRPGTDVAIGLDVAASGLWSDGAYRLDGAGLRLSGDQMIAHLMRLTRHFPVVSVEDALDQDDWDGWRAFTRQAAGMQVVGDDLFATNLGRVGQGMRVGAANAAVVKLNQNGTLSGTLAVLAALRQGGYGAIVAGRSGDTEDTFIADLAVGTGAGQIKIGAFRNTERLAKYNRLLRIEAETGLPFAGATALSYLPPS